MPEPKFFEEIAVPDQKKYEDGNLFPAVLSPNHHQNQTSLNLSLFLDAIRDHKPWLESLLHRTGAILFRGFPVASPSDFNDVVEAFGFPQLPYVGGPARRTHVVGRVYTANEAPPELYIPFHHEMAYAPVFPSKLFFFCEVEPGRGGETPLVLSHIIYERMKEMHPEFVSKIEQHGVIYIKLMGDEDDQSNIIGNGWKTTFKTDDKGVAEQRAAKLGSKLEWVGNVAKQSMGPISAVKYDESRQRKIWFNSLAIAYDGSMDGPNHDPSKSVTFGDGEELPSGAMGDCFKILEEESVAIPWQKGDIMLIDNMAVLHARKPLLEPPRRVLASICKAFGYDELPYVGGAAPRTSVVGRVFTANESPPDQKIPFHHEMAQVPEFPAKLFFFCEVEPKNGGETPIVLSHVIYEKMKDKYPEFVDKLEEHGLIYTRVLGEDDDPSSAIGRGWVSTFLTKDKSVAEERAAKLGMKLEWTDGVRTVMGPIPAIKFDKTRQRKIWFNSMVAAYTGWKDSRNDPVKAVTFGEGSPLPAHIIFDCLKILDEASVSIPWKNGDVLLLDNWAVLHARKPFDPPRRILASLCK